MNTKPVLLFILVFFVLLFGQGILVLFQLANGTVSIQATWPWALIAFPLGGTGILLVARKLKE